jgi:hypothetical protein
MRLKLVAILFIILTFSSCKSKGFIAQQTEVKNEVENIFNKLVHTQKRKNAVGINLLNLANFIKIDVRFLIKTKAKNKGLTQLSEQIQNTGLTKRGVAKYFKAQSELKEAMHILFDKMDKIENIKQYNSYFDLRDSYESNDNKIQFILAKYNTFLDKNKAYLNYPKSD